MVGRSLSLALTILFALVSSGVAHAVDTLKWEDLAPAWEEGKNPVPELSDAQQDDLYAILWGPNFDDPSGKMDDSERKARANLKASGVDADKIIAKIKRLRKEAEVRDQTLVEALDGKDVKIPGYVLPLEFSGTLVKKFLLVPYVGACIHMPPPPPNQIVDVTLSKGFQNDGLFAPVWVTGRITAGKTEQSLTLVDGTSKVSVGYSLSATKIEPYEE
ncbi:MAG: DUF3299 domain-containing protein [Hyphomicrobiales bacterium]|nr:DUF3299 domain-containing protein [Hyphomicrobiales bacterium]